MTALVDILVGLTLIIGALFALLAAVGVLRLPDVYSRMHAASKAGTVGSGLLLIALALDAGQLDVTTRAIAGVLFFLLTAPISAHLLAKAAFAAGYPTCASSRQDWVKELQGKGSKRKT
ncbi:MAG: monovalent cation/H(+) antiporter subunit G [Pannonibacter sp.]